LWVSGRGPSKSFKNVEASKRDDENRYIFIGEAHGAHSSSPLLH
jgi:hypothetical protein